MAHVFDEALALERTDAPNRLTGATHPAWANMVGPFGGITAATLVGAIAGHPDALGDPLALTVNYLAPIADGPFELLLNPVRTNRTNQHWIVELRQDGEPKTNATAVFGIHRDTWADTEALMPEASGPEDLERNRQEFPAWLSCYDLRIAVGAPVSELVDASPSSEILLWVCDEAGRPIDYAGLTAAADIFYPRVWLRTGQLMPAGTITLTTYFHASRAELDEVGADFVLGSAQANRFSRGFFDQSATLWSRSGTLLASSHQLVYFKG